MPEFNTIRINWNHYAKVLEAKTKAGVPVFTRVIFFSKDTSYLNQITKVPNYSKGNKVALGFIMVTWFVTEILIAL